MISMVSNRHTYGVKDQAMSKSYIWRQTISSLCSVAASRVEVIVFASSQCRTYSFWVQSVLKILSVGLEVISLVLSLGRMYCVQGQLVSNGWLRDALVSNLKLWGSIGIDAMSLGVLCSYQQQ